MSQVESKDWLLDEVWRYFNVSNRGRSIVAG